MTASDSLDFEPLDPGGMVVFMKPFLAKLSVWCRQLWPNLNVEFSSIGAADRPQRHFKNLDVLRVVAASAVIVSHGWMVAYGHDDGEPFKVLTGEILGTFCVFAFFIISGLLVTESVAAKPGSAPFLWRRFLRLYPAFFVCNAVTLTVTALMFSTDGWAHFASLNWAQVIKTFLYIDNSGWFEHVQFYEPNEAHVEQEVNGSIWTLQLEVLCYIWLINFIAARWLRPSLILGGVGFFMIMMVSSGLGDFGTNLAYSFPSFGCGVLCWFVLNHHKPKLAWAVICVAALALAAITKTLLYVFPPLAAYVILYLAVSAPFDLRLPKWIGDVSYGTYLWGWPVQQVVKAWIAPDGSALINGAISLPIALLLGWVSWHFIEKPALRFKALVPTRQRLSAAADVTIAGKVPASAV